MALSELSDRLDYLTSFSSQLVFVCTDKVKQQSQFVENFISQQNEQTDLALLTANELTPLAIYREKLFHQLISQDQSANYTLPLNQVLADLNRHEGPVLISIFQAEKLPAKLVKEIWELVLQSRFANNKQHLNVLLMGHSGWAEQTQKALAANSKEKPILINEISHEINSQAEQQRHAGDRSYNQQHQINQSKTTNSSAAKTAESRSPIYKKWWFITLSCLIFFTTFAGMLHWLYPNAIKDLLAANHFETTEKNVQEQVETEVNLEELVAALPVKASLEVKEAATKIDTNSNVSDSTVNLSNTQVPEKSLQIDAVRVGTENLVSNWPSTTDRLKAKTSLPSSIAIKNEKPLEQESDTSVKLSAVQPLDYPVRDVPVKIDIAKSIPNTLVQTSPEAVLNQAYISDTSALLSSLASNRFVIQLAAMSNYSLMQEYAEDKNLKDYVWLYTTQRYGGDWHVLLYSEDFATIQQARAKIAQLSSTMQKNVPFAKSLRQVKQEIVNSMS